MMHRPHPPWPSRRRLAVLQEIFREIRAVHGEIQETFRVIRDVNGEVHQIKREVRKIMTDQEKVLQYAARIETATGNIRQDIADLKAAHPEVDFSSLESSVGGLESLDAENPEPAPPAEPTE